MIKPLARVLVIVMDDDNDDMKHLLVSKAAYLAESNQPMERRD
jgi:hypothetical protein